MSELSVLHVLNSFVDASISRIVLRVVESLGTRDIAWHVGAVTSTGDMQDAFAGVGCRVIDFADGGGSSPRKSVKSYVREHGIDVVHTHTPRTIVEASLALRGDSGVKHIATKHLLNAPGDRRWGLAYALLDRLTLYLPDIVIPVSNTMGERIAAQPLLDRSKVVVVRNGIPVDDFPGSDGRAAERDRLVIPKDAIVLGYAGRIDKVKRIDLLLKAFGEVLTQHPRAHLVIAGEGQLKAEMQALAGRLDIGHAVTWPGFHTSMPGLLAAIDVYVQPSVNEGLSLSILEAMAAGRAVVATRVGGAEEIIAEGETGILVSPGSAAAIAAAVIRLLEDPDKRTAISRAGRARVESEFTLQTMADGYGAVYARVSGIDSAPTT